MASPKFDRICVELSRRIGDPVTTASSTSGKVLTAAERDAYVNKAMHRLFSDILTGVQGDTEKFLEILPELYAESAITSDESGLYTIANPNADFFKIIEGVYSSTYIKALPKYLYNVVNLGVNANYTPSATNYFVFEVEGQLRFLPVASLSTKTITIAYIKKPVKTTGAFFSNGDSEDMPFYEHWESKIAEIAEELVRIDRQYTS